MLMTAPRIVIALTDDVAGELAGDASCNQKTLRQIAESFSRRGAPRLRRLSTLLNENQYAGLHASRVIEHHPPAVQSLVGLFVLRDDSLDSAGADRLLQRFRELRHPDVNGSRDLETAYFQRDTRLPTGPRSSAPEGRTAVPMDDFNRFGRQVYLGPAGVGLPDSPADASYDGAGVQFIDIEGGWNVGHEAFDQAVRDKKPSVFDESDFAMAHGTAVLGIVLARGPDSKIRGIAPRCTLKGLYALAEERDAEKPPTAMAICRAVRELGPGDVLLLEVAVDASALPIEVLDAEFRAIQLAVSSGIIVIEPAANLGGELEAYVRDEQLAPAWADRHCESDGDAIPDSGAVIVGGCVVLAGQSRYDEPYAHPETRRGARVDCYGWAANVWTSFGTGPTDYDYFRGTSAASAVIAGIAILVQQRAKACLGRPLTPAEFRNLVRDHSNGTPVSARGKTVGAMPDVRKLFARIESMPII
jgi:Subtilase family